MACKRETIGKVEADLDIVRLAYVTKRCFEWISSNYFREARHRWLRLESFRQTTERNQWRCTIIIIMYSGYEAIHPSTLCITRPVNWKKFSTIVVEKFSKARVRLPALRTGILRIKATRKSNKFDDTVTMR